jgi:hypothetical protein
MFTFVQVERVAHIAGNVHILLRLDEIYVEQAVRINKFVNHGLSPLIIIIGSPYFTFHP